MLTKEKKNIAEALYVVNCAAKRGPKENPLYKLKKRAIDVLLRQGLAIKVGLQYSKGNKDHTIVLLKVENYYFHQMATHDDYKKLPHFGTQDLAFQNPKSSMPLNRAVFILESLVKRRRALKGKVFNTKRGHSSYLDGMIR